MRPTIEPDEQRRYPLGRFVAPAANDPRGRDAELAALAALPGELARSIHGLDASQLDTSYRPGGWTVRQVVHHLADAHLNGLLRFRLALTEATPMVCTYEPDEWAMLPDARAMSPGASLALLDGLHRRWTALLHGLAEGSWQRELRHPAYEAPLPLWWLLALYAWHGRHHVAQIAALRRWRGW